MGAGRLIVAAPLRWGGCCCTQDRSRKPGLLLPYPSDSPNTLALARWSCPLAETALQPAAGNESDTDLPPPLAAAHSDSDAEGEGGSRPASGRPASTNAAAAGAAAKGAAGADAVGPPHSPAALIPLAGSAAQPVSDDDDDALPPLTQASGESCRAAGLSCWRSADSCCW